ncbi:MAG: hypothetical protein U0K54_03035 [Acutalibacteraceae bacterium]|nr:hypothetical protein [Acutalibacteraceae bacterium]
MKFSFKQLTKKGLALMLTLCVILASFTFAFSVFAETAPYQVDFTSPAIPMVMGTQISLADIEVQFEEGGEYVAGSALAVSNVDEGLRYDEAAGTLAVYAKGVYPLTVSNDTLTKEIYVVARAEADTEFVIYDEMFSQNTLPSNWNSQIVTIPRNAWNDITTTSNNSTSFTGLTPWGNDNVTREAGAGWETAAFLTLKDDAVAAFTNYTVRVDVGVDPHNYGGIGIIGRANTDANGKLSAASRFIGAYNYVGTNWGQDTQSKVQHIIYEGTEVQRLETGVSSTNTNKWDYGFEKTMKNVYVTKFDGSSVKFSSPDVADFVYSFEDAAVQNGTVAFTLIGARDGGNAITLPTLQRFTVTLNNAIDDIPEAKEIEPAPEEPKPTIIIGSGNDTGEAEVEAVVGSDNTYTVALAPAVGYKVKTLSLIVNGDMRANLNHDNTGLVYTFTAADLANTVISVEYIPDDGTFNTVMAGASVWEERSAIRFGARTDLIKRSTTNTAVGTLDNRIKVGDTVYEITEIGMLLIPKGLFEGELTVDTKNVARQQVTKVVALTDTFSDIAINLVGIPTSYYDVEICSRMYVAYEENGETKYVYTDVIVRTYNQVLKAIGK